MKRQRIKEAVEIWGGEVVREAILMTEVSDPDGAWVLFQDEGMEEHAEAVEFIYFDE